MKEDSAEYRDDVKNLTLPTHIMGSLEINNSATSPRSIV